MTPRRRPFDAIALSAAADAERTARGLTWAELGRALGISPSTVRGMGARSAVEADGALGVCRWLGRSVESFAGREGPLLPAAGPAPCLRVDAKALHAALGEALQARGMRWPELAAKVSAAGMPTTAAMLTRYARGGRVDVDRLVALTGWLGRPVRDFVHWTWR